MSLRTRYHALIGVWRDFGLLLMTAIGYVPSHSFRRLGYGLFGLQIPGSSSLHWRARFFEPWNVVIGEHTTIGNDAFLDGRQGVQIGSCVNIAGEVRVYTLEHDIDDPDFGVKGGPVRIEDYVYVGTRVTILPNVTLGKGSVVASGAVVTKDVNPYTLVGGVPARPIRERTKNLRYKLGGAMRFQ